MKDIGDYTCNEIKAYFRDKGWTIKYCNPTYTRWYREYQQQPPVWWSYGSTAYMPRLGTDAYQGMRANNIILCQCDCCWITTGYLRGPVDNRQAFIEEMARALNMTTKDCLIKLHFFTESQRMPF